MAALSCYQPCRSHLAQPAKCYDDELDARAHAATLSLRRRQFIERCHDARYNDSIPEVSVKKTREELAKHASQNPPLTRRLNVDSGWSKVEEVRKKFEGAAASATYSRSFESPPRRRLADSIFASFKLPRKKDGMAAPRSLMPQQQKRKSAVELLAETKAFYVKSETVLDRKQELPLRVNSGLGQAIAAGGCHLVSSGTLNHDACCNPYATTRGMSSSRRAVSAGEGLQNTLRRLLEHHDSRENVYSPIYAVPHKVMTENRRHKDVYHEREIVRSQHTSGTFSGTSSSGTSGSKAQKVENDMRDKMNRPLSFGDARIFFPESFVIPRQRPNEIVLKSAYSMPSSHSSPSRSDAPPPPASPPLERRVNSQSQPSIRDELVAINSHKSLPDLHAQAACYTEHPPLERRVNSQSQPSIRDELVAINSHKSLPDLHAQAKCYTEHTVHGSGMESVGRSPRRRRHSSHQRTASCSSKGTRSNHSSLMSSCDAFSEHPSPGEDNYPSYNSRCGSGFARDSGGSSGHYTQRSAPPPHAHTHKRYVLVGGFAGSVVAAVPAQFQDGAPPPPSPPPPPLLSPHYTPPRVGIHFQASAPPPQFQDDPPAYDYNDYDCYNTPVKRPPRDYKRDERDYKRDDRDYRDYKRDDRDYKRDEIDYKRDDRDYKRDDRDYKRDDRDYKRDDRDYKRDDYKREAREYKRDTRDYNRFHESEVISKQPPCQDVRARPRIDDTQEYVNTSQMCPPPTEEVTSPLGTFKRQRCLRYKQRRPRPILRSKSDISDRYRRSEGRSPASAPCEGEDSPDSPEEETSQLRHFFEHLGLESRTYDAVIRDAPPDSPVFFSSASTVDSNQIVTTVDYTVQGPAVQKPIYRNTEPPSVVERNARIIKWLCQCRKTQMTAPP